ncbi:Tn3 family transposase [Undibacterium sp. Tian12W]|uniref:Tn3 family transposase n=1 Tax=Undibacterium sp. Tian12W TaxID=3413054 RepID=UPI003BF36292
MALPNRLSDFDVEQYFQLSLEDIAAITQEFRGDRRAGAAALLLVLRATGRPLDQVTALPKLLLRYIGRALDITTPTIASLRTIYKRSQTFYAHQAWAKSYLGFVEVDQAASDELFTYLSAHANEVVSVDELVMAGFRWLYDKKILIPGDRPVRDLARRCYEAVEQAIAETIKLAVDETNITACRDAVYAPLPGTSMTYLEWLKTPPKKHSPSTYKETLEKISFLKAMHVDTWMFESIPLEKQRSYGQRIQSRRPSMTKRLTDASFMIELVFFLRVTLLELSDSVVFQAGRRVADLVRSAYRSTQTKQASNSVTYRKHLMDIKTMWQDTSLTAEDFRSKIGELLIDIEDQPTASHAAHVRTTLVTDEDRIRPLLHSLSHLSLDGRTNQKHLANLTKLQDLYAGKVTELPEGQAYETDRAWQKLVNSSDRKQAFKALEAATMLGLRRGLRNGSVWVPHSASYRGREHTLIPSEKWERERERHAQLLKMPIDCDSFLNPLLAAIDIGLKELATCMEKGMISIDSDGIIHLPKLEALPEDPAPKRTLDLMFKEIGDVQFPDLMLDVDYHTNFSELLLGRRAKNEEELVALYAALIAHGTEIDAKGVAAMVPNLDPAHVSTAMRNLEAPGRLRRANERIVEFQIKHPITELWGTGDKASGDMMSLDASRHLLQARLEPRRKSQAIGIYTNVLDRYGIVYDTPIVLNERQAGVAIAGTEHYNKSEDRIRVSLLATDTHGYTNVAMALAKGLGFDLCPHLRNLSERKLYLPRHFDVPEAINTAAAKEVSVAAIRKGWDDYLRVLASARSGRVSIQVLMRQLGSAAQGDALHKAMDHLGRLLRTLFLCDYFTNLQFRRVIRTILNRGESVHFLQRAVYYGKVPPERGRRSDEMIAISGSHALLTNLVIAWNTARMQDTIVKWRKSGRSIEDTWLQRMGPGHFSHINFRGTFRFSVERYADALLQATTRSAKRRIA